MVKALGERRNLLEYFLRVTPAPLLNRPRVDQNNNRQQQRKYIHAMLASSRNSALILDLIREEVSKLFVTLILSKQGPMSIFHASKPGSRTLFSMGKT
jgi:hypothetical protein